MARRKKTIPIKYDEAYYLTGQYVGAFIPNGNMAHLRLLSVYKRQTTQKTMREAVEEFLITCEATHEPTLTVGELLELIAQQVYCRWRDVRRRYAKKSTEVQEEWEDFLVDVNNGLISRGIDADHVGFILSKVKYKAEAINTYEKRKQEEAEREKQRGAEREKQREALRTDQKIRKAKKVKEEFRN